MEGISGYDPVNLQPWCVQVIASMTVLATVAVALRLFSRYLKRQTLWWDDYLLIFSLAWNYVTVGFMFAMYATGMGIHADQVPMSDIVLMAKFLLVAEILYVYNLVWTKLSLLLMYYRIFHIPFFKKMAYILGGLTIAWVICITFLFIFICVPVEKIWQQDLPGHCIDQVGTWIANAASTILTDLAILLLPLHQVWKLHLATPDKVAITIAFGLGFFVVFTSAYRFSVLFSYSNDDPTYTLAPTVGWTAIEISAGIVSACLPTMRPAMQALFRLLGINIKMNTVFHRSRGTGQASDFASKPSAGPSKLDDELANPVSKKGSARAFHRLKDEGSRTSGESQSVAFEGHLRPDRTGGYVVNTVSSGNGEGDSLSGDEIPLHSIRVHTDVKHSTGPRP